MPTSGSPEQKPCTSEEGGKWGEVRRKRNPPPNGALYNLLQSSHNAPLILALQCVFHHPSVPSAPSWGNQIVNLYGLEEPHMENCVAGLKSCLCLSPPPDGRSGEINLTPGPLLRLSVAFTVCLLSWSILFPGCLTAARDVYMWSLALVWFLEEACQHNGTHNGALTFKKTTRNRWWIIFFPTNFYFSIWKK